MSTTLTYTDSTKGLIASAFSLGYALSLLPSGYLLTKIPYSQVLLCGILLWSVAQIITPTAAFLSVPFLLCARVLMGSGEAAAMPSLQLVSSTHVPPSLRSRYWGLVTACLSLGTITAYSFVPGVIDGIGWEGAFQALGVTGLAIGGGWWKVNRDLEEGREVETEGTGGEEVRSDEERSNSKNMIPPSYTTNNFPLVASLLASTIIPTPFRDLLRSWQEETPYREIFTSKPFLALTLSHSGGQREATAINYLFYMTNNLPYARFARASLVASNFFLYFTLTWLPTYYLYAYSLSPSQSKLGSTLPFILAGLTSLSGGVLSDYLNENSILSLTDVRKLMQSLAFLVPSFSLLYLSFNHQITYFTAALLLTTAVAFQSLSSSGFGCGAQVGWSDAMATAAQRTVLKLAKFPFVASLIIAALLSRTYHENTPPLFTVLPRLSLLLRGRLDSTVQASF